MEAAHVAREGFQFNSAARGDGENGSTDTRREERDGFTNCLTVTVRTVTGRIVTIDAVPPGTAELEVIRTGPSSADTVHVLRGLKDSVLLQRLPAERATACGVMLLPVAVVRGPIVGDYLPTGAARWTAPATGTTT